MPMQALVAGSMAPAQVSDAHTSPKCTHQRRLVHQLTCERDNCQARLDQFKVPISCHVTTVSASVHIDLLRSFHGRAKHARLNRLQ